MGIAVNGLDRELQRLLASLYLPTVVSRCSSEVIMQAMDEDKKHGYDVRTFILPTQIGQSCVVNDPPRELVREALEGLFED
jgi:3-dehydroquinate synthetase